MEVSAGAVQAGVMAPTELLKTLADPTRLRLLHALQPGELAVGELTEILGMAQSGISRHLSVLRAAGLVAERRDGATTWHQVAEPPADPRAAVLWPLVKPWLADLPEAAADLARRDRVVAARRPRGDSADYFQQVAPHWDSLRAAQYGEELRREALLELLPRDLTVLDVGTGTGFMLLGLARHGARLIGVDRSPAMLERAKENLAAAGRTDADLREGSMESLPVADGEADVVLANMVLHHAGDPRVALEEMARTLKPGGLLVLTDLASHELEWTREELADEWPGFAPDELHESLEASGFTDIAVRQAGTCTLTRSGRERHVVDVLLATGRKTDDPSCRTAAKPPRSRS